MWVTLSKLWATSPSVLLLALPFTLLAPGLGYAVQTSRWFARRPGSRAVRRGTLVVLAVAAAIASVTVIGRLGAAPKAAYLIVDGDQRRLAVLVEASRRGGGARCEVLAWTLPDAAFVGGDGETGPCRPADGGATVSDDGEARAIELWRGAIGAPPPASARVERLAVAGVPALALPEDVHAAKQLAPGCGCEGDGCGVLLAFRGDRRGTIPTRVGLTRPGEPPALAWSASLADVLDGAELLGAFPDGDACVFAGGRSGGRVVLAWVDLATGALRRRIVR